MKQVGENRRARREGHGNLFKSRILPPLALVGTLGLIWLLPWSWALALLLPVLWWAFFRPIQRQEVLIFLLAAIFISFQNYLVLRERTFVFAEQDFLLMPYYEPLLWGFYFLNIKRFFSIREQPKKLEWSALVGLLIVSLAFGIFSGSAWHSLAVFLAASLLLGLFREKQDIHHGLYAVAMGTLVEFFGVYTGHWSYPEPGFLGVPLWFVPMWFCVGMLGRRLVFPLVRTVSRSAQSDRVTALLKHKS